MRFASWRRLTALGAVATLVCAASAVGQNLSKSIQSGTNLTGPDFPTWQYSGAGGEQASGGLMAASIRLPATGVSQASESWSSGGYADRENALGELAAACDDCPRRGVTVFVGYDTWRGIADGNWQNNGIHTGVNYGTRLGRFSDWTGVGFQIGGSVGAYNWSGTDYRIAHQDDAQPQGFITYGLFRRAQEDSNWSAAVVQDWMLNSNYGVFAQNPTLSQWRGQLGYATNAKNEFGVWGTFRSLGDSREVPPFGTVSWRSVNQISGYWRYKWQAGGADTAIWVGLPEHDRLTGNGSLGDYLVGLLANVPLSDRIGLYALVTYMHPSAAAGPAGASEDAWNFSTGVSFYPARNARSSTIAGQCWMPLLPVANNGYFLVDQNPTY